MSFQALRSIPRLAESAPSLPRPIAELVDRMLGYEPSERPSDLREVKAVIEDHLRVRVTDFGPPAIDASSLAAVTSSVRDARAGAVSAPARRISSGAIALSVAACGARSEPTGELAPAYPVTAPGAGETPTTLSAQPQRIVALDPGSAELVAALGARDQLVGAPAGVRLGEGERPAVVLCLNEDGSRDRARERL